MQFKPMQIVGTVTAVLGMIAAIFAIDARYAKQDEMVDVKTEIIKEMRREVVKNRSVMITGMMREADDLEYQMSVMESNGEVVPRYMIDKRKQILRQVKELEGESTE